MNAFLSKDMLEATRLTREGRLMEASALLRRALQEPAEPASASVQDGPGIGRPPRMMDVDPNTGEASPTPEPGGRTPIGMSGAMPAVPEALAK